MLNKAVINLNTIRKNAIKVKEKLNADCKFCAVVKADAYGHGAVKVANALYHLADYFAVATVEEGMELRRSGIDKPVLILCTPVGSDYENVVRFNLTATIDCAQNLTKLFKQCDLQGKRASVHIKFNSGMNRQGVDGIDQLETLIRLFDADNGVDLEGMYSHLAFPQNKNSMMSAVNKFLLANNCVKRYNSKAICHLSASGGFLQGLQFDMVRIGLLLYGYKPFESDYLSVDKAMRVYAPVLKERTITCGDVALYGDKKANCGLDLTLVRYGYADGLMRSEIEGQFNNRCMDMTALIGKSNGTFQCVMDDAELLAQRYHTISYEILTKSALKAEKIYVN